MNGTVPSRQKRRWLSYAIVVVMLVLLTAAVAWYLSSESFQEQMRRKVVADLQQMTGTRAELKSFRWSLWGLEVEGRDLTLHGLESPGEAPYAHADRLLVRLKILSLLRRQIAIRDLELDRPMVHIIVYPDGSTNQPGPHRQVTGEAVAGTLFELAVDRLHLDRGELLWNDRRLPLLTNRTPETGR